MDVAEHVVRYRRISSLSYGKVEVDLGPQFILERGNHEFSADFVVDRKVLCSFVIMRFNYVVGVNS